jgi:hypothetical protein
MLQQQNMLEDDCTSLLGMIAKDDSGKGDWSVHRKVTKAWKNAKLNSEEKWAVLEQEIANLEEGRQVGQREWSVCVIAVATMTFTDPYTGSFAVMRRRNQIDAPVSKVRLERIKISQSPPQGALQYPPQDGLCLCANRPANARLERTAFMEDRGIAD